MDGSMRLRKAPDTWELRIYLGRTDQGKVRHKYVTFIGKQGEAKRELRRLSLEAAQRPAEKIDSSDRWGKATTFNDLINAWKLNGWQDLSPKTVSNYESLCRLYISRSIGQKKVASIGVYDLESYFRTLADNGLGVSGVRQVRAILHKAATLGRK